VGLYETGRGWSRYDLYPHALVHVATPFYHHLHIAQLEATADLTGEEALRETARVWAAAARRPMTQACAVGRKVAFRLVSPRGRSA
jgi:heparosan-N-sulfate-glucuronate 5-epimerase